MLTLVQVKIDKNNKEKWTVSTKEGFMLKIGGNTPNEMGALVVLRWGVVCVRDAAEGEGK